MMSCGIRRDRTSSDEATVSLQRPSVFPAKRVHHFRAKVAFFMRGRNDPCLRGRRRMIDQANGAISECVEGDARCRESGAGVFRRLQMSLGSKGKVKRCKRGY